MSFSFVLVTEESVSSQSISDKTKSQSTSFSFVLITKLSSSSQSIEESYPSLSTSIYASTSYNPQQTNSSLYPSAHVRYPPASICVYVPEVGAFVT